ncbi:hypothetical protein IWQ61_002495 [Dispira simplex]|nr:hypothetical protein IWQ61_002495 [Dispira simplex]
MRVFTLALATLMACFTTTPVYPLSLPPNVPSYTPGVGMGGVIPNIDNDDVIFNQIVASHQDLLGMQKEIVIFAFCSQSGKPNCIDYYFNAHTKFWGLLLNGQINERRRKAVDLIISEGDDLYVRFLFADGTIFCRKKDGSNTQAFTEVLISKERKNSESLWARSMKNSPEYFKTILDKYFARFHFDQEIHGVDQVLESTVQHDCANYYDVSMRDGLDAMLKWTVAEGLKERVDPILSAFVPEGRFNNFMLGSLYDAILMNNPDIVDILQAWVDCERVESFYKDFCKGIVGPLKDGKNITDIPRKPDILKQQHMSTSGKGEIGNIRNEISNFNRVGIDLTWLLDR